MELTLEDLKMHMEKYFEVNSKYPNVIRLSLNMKFFNYRFNRKDGITKANWYAPSLEDWKDVGFNLIDFYIWIHFEKLNHERPIDYTRVRLRVGNWQLTLQFNFTNDEPIWGISEAEMLLPLWKTFKNSGLSVEDIRKGVQLWDSVNVTTEKVIENIKRLGKK
jgi:hypothetical protein